MNHVYLLGAGFSRPLGAPLFSELLSREFSHRLAPILAKIEQSRHGDMMYVQTSDEFLRRCQNIMPGLDPESFIEICDSCELGHHDALGFTLVQAAPALERGDERIRSGDLRDALKIINRAIKVRVALETSLFLHDLPVTSERWLPYDRWFADLGPQDTLITTNYDTLIETLAVRRGMPYPGSLFAVSLRDMLGSVRSAKLPKLLKLHGSIDWYKEADTIQVSRSNNLSDLFERELIIGTPGLEKSRLASGVLCDVWSAARHAISTADVVSFVGYSFPISDNKMRMFILDTINQSATSIKAVNVVLGPSNTASQRIEKMLNHAVRTGSSSDPSALRTRNAISSVNLVPLYAQDYLPYYRPRSFEDIRFSAII